jgi:formate dehydrogenase iron-sulfur subunit
MNFGDREEMVSLAQQRLARVQKKHPKAQLVDADDVNVIYLITNHRLMYYESLMAATGAHGVTRHMALRK